MSVNDKRDISEAINAIGGGDYSSGRDLLFAIADRLNHARAKHPLFAEGKYHALGVIGAEFREFQNAVEHESDGRAKDESLDVIATEIRFYLGEHERQ